MSSNGKFDIKNLKRAWESGDVSQLMANYAEGFKQTEMDASTPPSNPRLRTRQQFADVVESGLARGAKMTLSNLVPGQKQAAYGFSCLMPSGVKMVGNTILELKNGKIIKDTTVQVLDK
ncbi:hypothetical protein A3A68_01490 [Candidatus Saccharibacteria bacterium RIFCSPLOWO2_01_FULL_48_13]|nr:MAG: hypothetical protein A2884_02510 [Candidatus Saccharibacteria bacterium RIFCSPHIGHO2_01_FULL_48_12]OGL37422.1 MAG: hypothetical protein A3A68_01490 [Candidatus Saccharibacteria bacterium RIFCSPLOWO2_01_FULL_48_13]